MRRSDALNQNRESIHNGRAGAASLTAIRTCARGVVSQWILKPQREDFMAQGAICECGHHFIRHWLTSQDEEGELWCLECDCRNFRHIVGPVDTQTGG